MEKVYLEIQNATQATDVDLGTKGTAGGINESSLNASMIESHSFIFTPYAYAVSGVFVWSALFLACFSVSLPHIAIDNIDYVPCWYVLVWVPDLRTHTHIPCVFYSPFHILFAFIL